MKTQTLDIESYLETVQQLLISGDTQRVIAFIQQQKNAHPHATELATFFAAEQAFYEEAYKLALQKYLEARGIPHYEFFCFRASAYASELMNNILKAIQFAKKALRIFPDDAATLNLLATIYTSLNQRDRAKIIKNKLAALEATCNGHTPSSSEDAQHFIPVGEQELEELSQIFSRKNDEERDLFAGRPACSEKLPDTEQEAPPPPHCEQKREAVVMPPGCDLFSHSPTPWDSEEMLTKRLYKKGMDRKSFVATHTEKSSFASDYAEWTQSCRSSTHNYSLSLEGFPHSLNTQADEWIGSLSRGTLINWERQGLLIHPGPHFLQDLHHHKCSITNIHTIIFPTSCSDAAYTIQILAKLLEQLEHTIHIITPTQRDHTPSKHLKIHCFSEASTLQLPLTIKPVKCSDQQIGVTLSCNESSGHALYCYLSAERLDDRLILPPCEVLCLKSSAATPQLIAKTTAKIIFLTQDSLKTAESHMHQLKTLQTCTQPGTTLLPSVAGVEIDLQAQQVLCQQEEPIALSNLCVLPTSRMTLQYFHKGSAYFAN